MANPWSPVHWSAENGVHADRHVDGLKCHQPYAGQTTLDTFFQPSYRNDIRLQGLGGEPPSLTYGQFGTILDNER